MFKILFYLGLSLAIIFFILSIILFFSKHIVSVCRYLFKMKKRKIKYIKPQKRHDVATTVINYKDINSKSIQYEEKTEILKSTEETDDENSTELLPILKRK